MPKTQMPSQDPCPGPAAAPRADRAIDSSASSRWPTGSRRRPGRRSRRLRGTVPLPRRLLLADWRRLVASLAGVGLALMLILLLDGLSSGIDSRVTVFEESTAPGVFVTQPGADSFLGSLSVLPAGTEAVVAARPGISWTASVRGFFTVPVLRGSRVPVYVIGSHPGKAGGPWSLQEGRAALTDDEVSIGGEVARKGGLGVGAQLDLLGRSFKVVGIAADADMFMASFVFMTHHATDTMLAAPNTTSYVLAGTDDPEAARADLRSLGLHALTRAEIEQNDLALKGQAYSTGLSLVVAVAFAVGTLVIAHTIYAAVTERRREYGILKAIGATKARLYRVVLGQSLALAGGGLAVGGVMFMMGVRVLGWLRPQFEVAASAETVLKVVVSAMAMGAVASLVPARRMNAMEPATAFRGVT